MKRTYALLTAAICFCVFLSSCGAKTDSAFNQSSSSVAMTEESFDADTGMPSEGGLIAENTSEESENLSGEDLLQSQKIIRNFDYQIETLEFEDAVAKLEQLCEEWGGYIESSSVSGSGIRQVSSRYADYTLRIPQQSVEKMESGMSSVGTITYQDTSLQNITTAYYDVESRLKSLRTQEERLLALLEKSGSLSEIIELENALAQVTYEIESYTSTLKQYDNLVDFSTVTVHLREVLEYSDPKVEPKNLGERIAYQFTSSLKGIGTFFEGLLVFLAGNSPVLILIALVIVGIVWIWKKRRRSLKVPKDKETLRTDSSEEGK